MPTTAQEASIARFRGEAAAVRERADWQIFTLLAVAAVATCFIFVFAMVLRAQATLFLWPILGALVLQGVAIGWTRRTRRVSAGVTVLATMMIAGISGVVFVQRGAHAPGLVYGLTTIAVVLIAGRRRLGLGLALWLSVWTAGLTWAAQTGRLSVEAPNPLGADNARLMAFLAALVLIALASRIVRRRQQALDALLERALALTEAERDAARALADRRARTVAEISHEIRTPMTGIVGAAQLLAKHALSPAQRQLLSIQRQSAERLLQLVNAVLDQARTESLPPVVSQLPLDPRQLACEVAELFAAPAHRKGIEIVWFADDGVPQAVLSDAVRVRQILSNLVSNAVKFTDRGAVQLRLLRPAAARLRYEVSDTGRGFAAAHAETIFEPFISGADGAAGHHSTGLGLTISRELARAMGGELSGRSEVGKGSCFVLELPCEPVAADELAVRPARRPQPGLLWVVGASAPLQRQLQGQLSALGASARFTPQAPSQAQWQQVALQVPAQAVMVDIAFGEFSAAGPLSALMDEARRQGRRLIVISSVAQDAALGALDDVWQVFRPPNLDALSEALAWAFGGSGEAAAAAPPAAAAPRVLLADDNAVNQIIGRSMLEALGAEVMVVQDGRAALQACLDAQFDLVLMDLQMPEMDGLEATQRLRAHEIEQGLARQPVVAVSGQLPDDIVKACREAGIDSVLAKPYTLDQLRTVIAASTERATT